VAVVAVLAVSAPLLKADAADGASSSSGGTVSELAPLKVEGNLLMAQGRAIRLRGINWGWWHLAGTRYSEADMQHLAQWGANVVRLAFTYSDLEADGDPVAWKEDGFRQLDEVVQWGKRYGIYVVLDMHVAPGGQSPIFYCAGGRNQLWTDPAAQARFIALWSEIVRRYRDRPEVAAYELMNEPGSKQKTPELLYDIDRRAIAAIRAVDPAKVIVVGGDQGSGPGDLDAMKMPDDNILYTFHWYLGSGGNEDWLGTPRQTPGISGTQDWTRIEQTFTAPPRADHLSIVLRSIANSGTAWFDDVEVADAAGRVLQAAGFDKDAQGFHPEVPQAAMTYDPTVGHDKPGSLKISGTTGFNGWIGERVGIQAGQSYRISAWVKLDGATGDTYLGAPFFRIKTEIDPDAFQQKIVPAVAFAKKYNVPVWVGEFGCDNANPDDQIRWVNASIGLFEPAGFSWTYWNDKETTNPQSSMGLQPERRDGSDYPVNARLLRALSAGWVLNRPLIN